MGLDNAGKTTMLHMLKGDRIRFHDQCMRRQNYEEFQFGNIKIKTFDLGGHIAARRLYRDYMSEMLVPIDGVVWIVDAADKERFNECQHEFDQIVKSGDLRKDVPILILGNKIDKKQAVSKVEIRHALKLDSYKRLDQKR
eukprot:UN24952